MPVDADEVARTLGAMSTLEVEVHQDGTVLMPAKQVVAA